MRGRSSSPIVTASTLCGLLLSASGAFAQGVDASAPVTTDDPLAEPAATPSLPAPASAAPAPTAAAPSASVTPPPASSASAPPPRVSDPGYVSYGARQTPRQTVAGFLREVRDGRLRTAAGYLDMRGFRWDKHAPPEAAEKLAQVIERRLWISMADLSDEPEGSPDDGEDYERLGTVEVDGLPIPIALTRQVAQDGTHYWSFAQVTVSHIPELHAARGPSWLARNVPESWKAGGFLGLATWQWVGVVGVLVVAFPLGWLAGILLMWGLGRLAARTPTGLDDLLVQKTRGPVRFALGWLSASVASSTLDLPARFEGWLSPLLQTPFILASGWFLAQVVRSITHSMGDLAPRTGDEGLHARRMRTQLVMLRKLAIVLIAIVTGAIVFLQFEVVRNIGVSLLASAGVVSVALGFAAQKSLGAVIAGIQLSFTQPIRIDDVVVLDDQWGTVEEINLTYVLLKLWDERRLVVPIEHFLTKVFENWSKPGSELIGIVEVAVDPTAPVSTLRDAVEAFAAAHADHDGREVALQVVDLNEHRALLRARVSTSDITKTFGLRCALREHLMRVLQDLDGGRFLPRARWQVIEGGRSAEDHRGEEGGLENERPIRDGAG